MTPLPKRRWSTLRQGRRRAQISLNLANFSGFGKQPRTKSARKKVTK